MAEGGGGQPSSLSSEILKSNAQPWKLRLWRKCYLHGDLRSTLSLLSPQSCYVSYHAV